MPTSHAEATMERSFRIPLWATLIFTIIMLAVSYLGWQTWNYTLAPLGRTLAALGG